MLGDEKPIGTRGGESHKHSPATGDATSMRKNGVIPNHDILYLLIEMNPSLQDATDRMNQEKKRKINERGLEKLKTILNNLITELCDPKQIEPSKAIAALYQIVDIYEEMSGNNPVIEHYRSKIHKLGEYTHEYHPRKTEPEAEYSSEYHASSEPITDADDEYYSVSEDSEGYQPSRSNSNETEKGRYSETLEALDRLLEVVMPILEANAAQGPIHFNFEAFIDSFYEAEESQGTKQMHQDIVDFQKAISKTILQAPADQANAVEQAFDALFKEIQNTGLELTNMIPILISSSPEGTQNGTEAGESNSAATVLSGETLLGIMIHKGPKQPKTKKPKKDSEILLPLPNTLPILWLLVKGIKQPKDPPSRAEQTCPSHPGILTY
jgi:hypothetical protein